ncbi:winged helix-turn-helix transcriptional regulator [Streptomyces libani]|uniref:winged helix-turn-helix transcriptional regulator n=1 Tax=Streptomyces TaxID=1883 RepID=UPI0037D9DB7E
MAPRRNTSPDPRHRDSTPPPAAGGDRESDEEACREVLQILGLIGSKWSILIVGQLRDRTMRFGELHRAVKGISQRMLTLTLRQLERDGLLTRTVHPSVPPRVDYALTALGATLLDSVVALGEWATAHRHEINNNRHRYDATHPTRT